MRFNLEKKSLIVGCGFGIAFMLVVGAASGSYQPRDGRFQVTGTGQGAAVIVDTATGEAWSSGTVAQTRAMNTFWEPKVD